MTRLALNAVIAARFPNGASAKIHAAMLEAYEVGMKAGYESHKMEMREALRPLRFVLSDVEVTE